MLTNLINHFITLMGLAPMAKHIDPKPTKYRGITFRSRLEARWAVCLDNCTNVMEWTYEPATFKMKRSGWHYTPDFLIKSYRPLFGMKTTEPSQVLYYLEVKPNSPTKKYLHTVCEFSEEMKYPLLLACGDFYDRETILIQHVFFDGTPIFGFPGFEELFTNLQLAAKLAGHFRFDLREV